MEDLENQNPDVSQGSKENVQDNSQQVQNATEANNQNAELQEQANWYESDYYGSPDSYDYKDIQLPEGMKLNSDMTAKFNDFAKKTNMSQKSANECMQLAVEHTNHVMQQALEAYNFAREENVQKWDKLCEQDEYLKGEKYDKAISIANMAMDKLIPQNSDFKEELKKSGLNHHPVLINAFRQLGEFMLPPAVQKGYPAPKEKSAAEIIYPEMYEKK